MAVDYFGYFGITKGINWMTYKWNDNNAPERVAIKKNSVVNSESKKYKYIYISQWICSALFLFWWLWPWAIPNSCILACSLIVSLNLYDDGPTVV